MTEKLVSWPINNMDPRFFIRISNDYIPKKPAAEYSVMESGSVVMFRSRLFVDGKLIQTQ